ncbi:cysteine--tRNA ligase [Streptococcus sanguinis]|uniref:Cysteine--tRNA ligase n=1 Tax=Streptococcus sanguinis TaxID=1305 RepID=A0A427Z8X8_STRSA|nr:cysteine--tRNA ligase [Streptococcus sanguinis]RSI10592.1 Cysteine--tRNA ligase [Streptococcus sanguinis]
MIKIYDSLTRKFKEFIPINGNQVLMYVCGPTVYDYIHIGNARSIAAFDTIRKYLEYRGYIVKFVSNFTDIDDRILKRAKKEGIAPREFSNKYIQKFSNDIKKIHVKKADCNPRVSDYMNEIIAFIEILKDKGFAYETEGNVFFDVSKSKDYGKLAKKSLDELLTGASGRLGEENKYKLNDLDFVLWKSSKNEFSEGEWQSPWGKGRPGWHIECSVMSLETLGESIDIHGGGADLEFPHHTNEIAQSEAKTGKKFVNYWMHNGFVNINDEKMSKSLGNFVTLRDLLSEYDGDVIRFFLSAQHYRKPINFSVNLLHEYEKKLKYLKNTYRQTFSSSIIINELNKYIADFNREMEADFNAANALTVIFEFAHWINSGNYNDIVKEEFKKMMHIFGVELSDTILSEEVTKLIERRNIAKKEKNYILADQLRDKLGEMGIKVIDTSEGVRIIE